ncbi:MULTISPECIES: ABC transporter permease [unclassified Paenibacillus]|uniref:ABC transporter permease n=1 Tax=unclassified Paenibacillus TaxID=185978 RepID=UPI001AE64C8C|nr:ABC-2 type transport system permease protein [Paenibacillus sp. PvP091]MBP1171884.1 ABC-2 type transport system permease protein [Paenibacillus sp. PvR098]MBP2438265.1 ABC-2 type transport system permease protein [Paenibacillus sp. PvP052]
MKAYIQLTLAQLRLFGRNRQVLFWTLFFPVFFMVMLGSFLGKDTPVTVSGVVIDLDQTAASQALIGALEENPVLQLKSAQELNAELEVLKRGDHQLVVVIPQGFAKQMEARTRATMPNPSSQASAALKVYYDETNAAVSQIGLQLLTPIVDGIDKELSGYSPAIKIEPEGVQSLKLRYIDFLVPGILAMMIMSNNLNGVTAQIASWRERGILRRMQSTTLHASTFIGAQITARLALNGLQAVIVLLVGYLFFGTQVNGSWLTLLFFIMLGTLAFMATGFIVAGLAKTPESAAPIAGFISFPMLFVGGVFFPIQNMPEFLQPVVKLIPISHLTTALRQVMNVGATMGTMWVEAVFLGIWLVLAFIIASLTFKWE